MAKDKEVTIREREDTGVDFNKPESIKKLLEEKAKRAKEKK